MKGQILFTTILRWRIEHTNLEGILLESRKALIWGFDGMEEDINCTYGVCNFLPFGSIVRFKRRGKKKKKSDRVK